MLVVAMLIYLDGELEIMENQDRDIKNIYKGSQDEKNNTI